MHNDGSECSKCNAVRGRSYQYAGNTLWYTQSKYITTMIIDALAPCVARPSVEMVFIMRLPYHHIGSQDPWMYCLAPFMCHSHWPSVHLTLNIFMVNKDMTFYRQKCPDQVVYKTYLKLTKSKNVCLWYCVQYRVRHTELLYKTYLASNKLEKFNLCYGSTLCNVMLYWTVFYCIS